MMFRYFIILSFLFNSVALSFDEKGKRISEEEFNKVQKKEDIFLNQLNKINSKHKCFKKILSAGLWISVEFDHSMSLCVNSLIRNAHKSGLMILKANSNTIRFSPSLIIEDNLIAEGLAIFEEVILQTLQE